METYKNNSFIKIVSIIIILMMGITIVLLYLATREKQQELKISPTTLKLAPNRPGLLTIIASLDSPIGNTTTITPVLLFNVSNPDYVRIIDPLTLKPVNRLSFVIPNVNGGMVLKQVFINASLVKGQPTSNWWIDIIFKYRDKLFGKQRVMIIVKK